MNKAVFLDRDGTINVDKNYLYKIEDFEYLPGVKNGLKLLQDAGYLLIIITNQSGIARGYYTEDEYKQLEKWMINDLEKDGIHISACYYCPHHPDAVIPEYRIDCGCRKPKTQLFELAAKELDIDLEASVCVGDKMRDLSLINKGVKGFLLYSAETGHKGFVTGIDGGLFEMALFIIESQLTHS